MSEGENGPDELSAASVIGTEVKVKVAGEEPIQGHVYTHDALSGCLVLNNKLESGKHEVRFILTNNISKSEVVSTGNQEPLETLPTVNVRALEEREKKAEVDAQLAIACIGKNVTEEAQEIFDALRKTYPCEWDESKIVVLGEAEVSFPYGKDSCKGEGSVVERVKMILERYWTEKNAREVDK